MNETTTIGGYKMPEGHQSHINSLDMIRGLAAMAVASYHAREVLWVGAREFVKSDPTWSFESLLSVLSFPLVWGGIGVPIFFVLSGYVIHRRMAVKLADDGAGSLATNIFLKRRLIRIYPTLFAAVVLTSFFDGITKAFVPDHPKLGDTSLTTLFWNLAALQGVFSTPYGSNGPLWTLAVEIQFYLFYPIALLLRMRLGQICMVAGVIFFSACGYIVFESNGVVAFPTYYFSWWLGAYVADREANRVPPPSGWQLWSILLITLGCSVSVLLDWPYFAHMAWASGFAIVLTVLVRSPFESGRPWTQVLAFIGKFSYSLYAIHLPTLVLISALIFRGQKQSSIFVPILAFGVVLILAFGFYLLAERPFVRLLARLPKSA